MTTGALIVAAGLSSRMGQFKPLLKLGSRTIVQRLVESFDAAGVSPIVLITGNQAEVLEEHLKSYPVVCLRNGDFATTQMFDSVVIGLRYLQNRCAQALFTPADIPLVTQDTLRKLIDSGEPLACPVYGGREGHPLLISSKLFSSLLQYKGNHGLYGAIMECGHPKRAIPVEDQGILFDIDTPQDYETLLHLYRRQTMRPEITIALAMEGEFFGPELARLLTCIGTARSMKPACQQAGLSYSKGWRLINEAESQLGYPLVLRQHGGKDGGKTLLTERGSQLLRQYHIFEAEAKNSLAGLFAKHFSQPL